MQERKIKKCIEGRFQFFATFAARRAIIVGFNALFWTPGDPNVTNFWCPNCMGKKEGKKNEVVIQKRDPYSYSPATLFVVLYQTCVHPVNDTTIQERNTEKNTFLLANKLTRWDRGEVSEVTNVFISTSLFLASFFLWKIVLISPRGVKNSNNFFEEGVEEGVMVIFMSSLFPSVKKKNLKMSFRFFSSSSSLLCTAVVPFRWGWQRHFWIIVGLPPQFLAHQQRQKTQRKISDEHDFRQWNRRRRRRGFLAPYESV